MKGIIGRKLGMTQIYTESGEAVPVTVIEAGPCTVLAVRTPEKDGYCAVQLGFADRKPKNVSKAVRGHVAAAGLQDRPPAVIREIRLEEAAECALGDSITAETFSENDFVDITARSKGRGFQGAVKRWGFAGGRESHGRGGRRRTGSVGMCVSPARVRKGKKMPGQMGNKRRTMQNLKIAAVRPDDHLLLVKGSVPGPNGGMVIVRSACKK